MLALIFANGSLEQSPELSTLLKQADLLVAADGGANHCARLGITPDILLGDLDSIDPAILTEYKNRGVAIHRHPPRKDATDLELALEMVQQQGAHKVWLIGALGGRWDMSLGNIMLAAGDNFRGSEIFLLGRDCSMKILHPGKTHTIKSMPGQKVSFLPLKGDVYGVTLTGFEYPLTNHTIPFGSTLGVSNIMQKDQATLQHTEGVLLSVLFNE